MKLKMFTSLTIALCQVLFLMELRLRVFFFILILPLKEKKYLYFQYVFGLGLYSPTYEYFTHIETLLLPVKC